MFKTKDKNTDQENEDFTKMNVKTRQEMRKDERKEKKMKIREKKENKDIAVVGSQMQFTGVMFVECTPFGELVRRLQKVEDRLGVITDRRNKLGLSWAKLITRLAS